MPARARPLPLLVTGLVVLAALAAALWLVFFAPSASVGDAAVLTVPPEPKPAPMMKPDPPATRPPP